MNLRLLLVSLFTVLAFCAQSQNASIKYSQAQAAKNGPALSKPAASNAASQIDLVVTPGNGYVAGTTHNIYFNFDLVNTDFEYIDSVSMTFPDGVVINSVSNDEIFAVPFDLNGAPEEFNGINGQTVSWGDNDNDYGGVTSGFSYDFSVNCTFGPGLTGDLEIQIHASGDEFGANPGDQDLIVPVSPDLEGVARLQIIHNSPDLGAGFVDVRVNGDFPDPSYDDLEFRTATPFLDVPAATPLDVTVNAPSSEDDMFPLFQQEVSLDPGITYVLVADGLVNTIGYEDFEPFSLEVFAQAREVAVGSEEVDVLVHHGSPGAPIVNVVEPFLNADLVSDLGYSEFAGYLSLAIGDYALQITNQDGSEVVGTYDAPLELLGLENAAITVLASGFVDPSVNSDAAGFGLWVALPAGGDLVELDLIDIARVQVVHNSADDVAELVDVRINGQLLPALDDLAFRTATPFITTAANEAMLITVHDSGSEDDSNPLFTLDLPGGLEPNAIVQIIAEGLISGTGYAPSSAERPFNLNVVSAARTNAAIEGNVDILVSHGSTDAPLVDVNEITLPSPQLVNDISFGQTQGYVELATANYGLEVENANTDEVLATYSAPLEVFGLENFAMTIFASGFVDPSANSNGPSFGLFVSLPTGGPLGQLPAFVFNDTPCEATTIEVDGAPILGDNSGATPDDGEVAPPNSGTSCSEPGTWCDGGGGALGIINNSTWYQFTAPPSGGVEVSTCGEGTVMDSQVAVWSAADCADYTTFELFGANDDYDTDQFNCQAVNMFASVARICNLVPGDTYFLQLDGYLGSAGIYELSVTSLEESECQARIQVVHNSADDAASIVDVRVNGGFLADDYDDLGFRNATQTISVPAGLPLDITINSSTSVDDSDPLLLVEGVILDLEGSYQVIAQGIASALGYNPGPDTAPLELEIIEGFLEENPNTAETFIAISHGVTDAPAVDVDEIWTTGTEIFGNIAYGGTDGYAGLPAVDYQIAVTQAGQNDILEAYGAPLASFGGQAITIFASGFLDPEVNNDGPDFGLWVSVPNGGPLIPLDVVTSIDEIQGMKQLNLFPNPTSEDLTIEFDLVDSKPVTLELYSTAGQLVLAQELGSRPSGFQRETMNLNSLSAGLYILSIQVGHERLNKRVQVLK